MFTSTIPQFVLFRAAQQVRATFADQNSYALTVRLERGLTLALEGAVMPYTDCSQPWRTDLFQVRSSNHWVPPFSYRVDFAMQTCECPDFANGYHCKHLIAVQIFEQARLELLPLQST